MKVIKKYKNRKLYDTDNSCYVNLDDIQKFITQGKDIQVIDSEGHTITNEVLKSIIPSLGFTYSELKSIIMEKGKL